MALQLEVKIWSINVPRFLPLILSISVTNNILAKTKMEIAKKRLTLPPSMHLGVERFEAFFSVLDSPKKGTQ